MLHEAAAQGHFGDRDDVVKSRATVIRDETTGSSMSDSQAGILMLHPIATAAMVGPIWFVQLVRDPIFAAIGSGGSVEDEQRRSVSP